PRSLRDLIARINRIRRAHPALQQDWNLRFHRVDNPLLVCYSKATDAGDDVILSVVSLDPQGAQAGSVELELERWSGGEARRRIEAGRGVELLGGQLFEWTGGILRVELDPERPAAIIEVGPSAISIPTTKAGQRQARSERR
ncbi:MAG TPA: hypothetical protein VJK71_03390, partial [Gemmatimonadales bacterium]|nr:hypothetical protein [Gemmatimonadales bacterium]